MSDLAGHLPPALGDNEPRAEPVPTESGARAVFPNTEPRASARAVFPDTEPRALARAVFHDVKALRAPTPRRPTGHHNHHTLHSKRHRPAFSLMELMIGIIILGLGMVMVATIFPVGWSQARILREYTVHKAVTANAHATVKSLVRVSSPTFNASSFLGDLVYDPHDPDDPSDDTPISTCPDYYEQIGDTWVHALNLENIQVAPRRFLSEDPWHIQAPQLALDALDLPDELVESSFFRKQISFHQRVYPPLEILPNDADDAQKRRWDDALATRRFCWTVFHRLREVIDPNDLDATGNIRAFDVYFVTLRRPNPTYRYARQNPTSVPDACNLTNLAGGAVVPTTRPPDDDVMFPVPWRVQVEFPATLLHKEDPVTGDSNATGIPTEIMVPPPELSATPQALTMWGQMFPTGTRFIDEITGEIYRVVKRRVTGDNAEQAHLTLDREVFLEYINLDMGDPRCGVGCEFAPYQHLLRTVWIFPPSVQATRAKGNILVFEGSQPVVDIEVQALKIPPTE